MRHCTKPLRSGGVGRSVESCPIIEHLGSGIDWELQHTKPLRTLGVPIWIADAHRDNGKRLVVRADEKLTALLELQAAIRSGQNG